MTNRLTNVLNIVLPANLNTVISYEQSLNEFGNRLIKVLNTVLPCELEYG